MKINIIGLVVIVFLGGCTNFVDIAPSTYKFDKAKPKGLVAISVSRTGDRYWDLGSISIESEGNENGYYGTISLIDLEWVGDEKLVVFEVEAGTYYFRRYKSPARENSRIFLRELGTFEIEAGKVTYIGNFNIYVKKQSGTQVTFYFKICDQKDKDFRLLEQAYPQFSIEDVLIRVPKNGCHDDPAWNFRSRSKVVKSHVWRSEPCLRNGISRKRLFTSFAEPTFFLARGKPSARSVSRLVSATRSTVAGAMPTAE